MSRSLTVIVFLLIGPLALAQTPPNGGPLKELQNHLTLARDTLTRINSQPAEEK